MKLCPILAIFSTPKKLVLNDQHLTVLQIHQMLQYIDMQELEGQQSYQIQYVQIRVLMKQFFKISIPILTSFPTLSKK